MSVDSKSTSTRQTPDHGNEKILKETGGGVARSKKTRIVRKFLVLSVKKTADVMEPKTL